MLIDGVDLKGMAPEDLAWRVALMAQEVFLLAGTVEENIRLARALAGDPRVLVLDEASSSVDTESERLIHKALPRVMVGRTCLVVASHRLTTVRHADRILVMQRGCITEQSKHTTQTLGGVYARLVRLQTLREGMGTDTT